MTDPPAVLPLEPEDAERYARLRLRMLHAAPWAYASSPEEDEALDPARLAAVLADRERAILAVEAGGGDGPLVAAAGIARQRRAKSAHRAGLWGVFVEEAHRGRGLGRAVVSAAIELAFAWDGVDYVDLGVSERSPEARSLYESLGFRAWGREPGSLQCEGRRYDEIFMSLRR
jgi:RimJ/RimL family protein N-acetyltransferase